MSATNASGILLVAGGLVFFVLGFGILPFRRQTTFQKIWIACAFSVAIGLTATALALLAWGTRDGPGAAWILSGAVIYAIGTPLMLATMVAFASVTPVLPGAEAGFDGERSPLEKALASWTEGLYVVYMIAAFVAIVLVGVGLVQDGRWPPWIGWSSVLLGGALLVSFPLKFVLDFWIADLPLWVHVWALVAGFGLARA